MLQVSKESTDIYIYFSVLSRFLKIQRNVNCVLKNERTSKLVVLYFHQRPPEKSYLSSKTMFVSTLCFSKEAKVVIEEWTNLLHLGKREHYLDGS